MMKCFLLALVSVLVGADQPETRQALPQSDIDVLQLILAFEHMESAFYQKSLEDFSSKDFRTAGYSDEVWDNLQFIARDDSTHVRFWEYVISVNGVTPIAACTYNFTFSDVPSFIAMANVIEGVSTSSYLGCAFSMSTAPYVLATGSILATEAIHTSFMRTAAGKIASSAPFGTPLDPASVFTLLSEYTTSCPSSNPPLPWTAYAKITVIQDPNNSNNESSSKPYYSKWWDPLRVAGDFFEEKSYTDRLRDVPQIVGLPKQGDTVVVSAQKIPEGSFVTFAGDIDIVSVLAQPQDDKVSAVIPVQSMGQTYIFLTSTNNTGKMISTDIIAGPAVLEVAPLPTDIPIKVEE